jgi:hypothetical protein
MEFKELIAIFSALLTPLIAILAIFIAYRQYKVNRSRLNHELYVRRLEVFKAIRRYISSIAREGKTDFPTVIQFYSDAGEADFLFKDDIPEQIEKLYKKGLELAELHEKLYPSDGSPGLSVGKERSKVAKQQSEALKWFFEELPNTKRLFKRYLRVT